MTFPDHSARLPRRTVFKWFAAAAAALQLGQPRTIAAEPPAGAPLAAKGYGTDPKLNASYGPGDFWPLTFTAQQRETAKALSDIILPADDYGPAASELRVTDYVDEWVSAPYPAQQLDRAVIPPGLDWLDRESGTRFNARFAALTPEQSHALCDDICYTATAKPEHRQGAIFFSRFRAVAAGAYYCTIAGWKAIGYVGNIPLASFAGPPPEVLARLGVEQTVK
jgi:hypothetical protein